MDANDTTFVVVGAGHMLGPRGLCALLQRAGYRVELVNGQAAPARISDDWG